MMLSSALHRSLAPAATVAGVTLLCVVGLTLADRDSPLSDVHTALCAAGFIAAVALVLLRHKSASWPVLLAAVLGLAASAAVWGSARSTVPGTVAVVPGVAFFLVAVLATLVRAERSEESRGSSID
jgi:hypothetical protein